MDNIYIPILTVSLLNGTYTFPNVPTERNQKTLGPIELVSFDTEWLVGRSLFKMKSYGRKSLNIIFSGGALILLETIHYQNNINDA